MTSLNSVSRTSHFKQSNYSTKYRTVREPQALKLPGFQSTECSDCGPLGCDNHMVLQVDTSISIEMLPPFQAHKAKYGCPPINLYTFEAQI